MINKHKDYILLLSIFLLIIFSSSLDNIYLKLNKDLANDNIINNYNEYLENNLNSLEEYYNLDIDNNLNLNVSKVKYQDIYNIKNEITIYKGYLDNIKKGSSVLTNKGLIGVVSKCYKHYSIVKLITNKDSNISVKINNAIGILKVKDEKLVVTNINNYESINVNDEIYTSGLGNLKENIYIGKVESISLKDTLIEQEVVVSIDNNLDKLNYLYIME